MFFKEKLINSCNLAAIDFDIPVCSILAESFFAFGGIFILLNYVPIIFASLHQVGAMMIFLIFISIIHKENIYN